MNKKNHNENLVQILKTQVPLIVYLADKVVRLEDVMAFSPGSIIEFQKNSDDLLEIMVNDRCIGKGEVVKVGESFGIQIKEISPPEDTIKKLGPA